jgi:hypothetical protein
MPSGVAYKKFTKLNIKTWRALVKTQKHLKKQYFFPWN